MSTSIFHEPDQSIEKIQVICSSNERRGYENKSVFFVHPLFNGTSTWPTKTNIVCLYDGEPFDGIPIPLPIDCDPDANTYTCYGIFCSASCVKAYMDYHPAYSNSLSMIWLKKIMCEVFLYMDDIVAAPPVDLLEKHGGYLKIDHFRASGKQQTAIVGHRLPFFTCALAFELVRTHPNANTNTNTNNNHHKQSDAIGSVQMPSDIPVGLCTVKPSQMKRKNQCSQFDNVADMKRAIRKRKPNKNVLPPSQPPQPTHPFQPTPTHPLQSTHPLQPTLAHPLQSTPAHPLQPPPPPPIRSALNNTGHEENQILLDKRHEDSFDYFDEKDNNDSEMQITSDPHTTVTTQQNEYELVRDIADVSPDVANVEEGEDGEIDDNDENNDINEEEEEEDENEEKDKAEDKDEDKEDEDINNNDLLPSTIKFVAANVGSQWNICGLKRPDIPVDQPETNVHAKKSLFQDYYKSRMTNPQHSLLDKSEDCRTNHTTHHTTHHNTQQVNNHTSQSIPQTSENSIGHDLHSRGMSNGSGTGASERPRLLERGSRQTTTTNNNNTTNNTTNNNTTIQDNSLKPIKRRGRPKSITNNEEPLPPPPMQPSSTLARFFKTK